MLALSGRSSLLPPCSLLCQLCAIGSLSTGSGTPRGYAAAFSPGSARIAAAAGRRINSARPTFLPPPGPISDRKQTYYIALVHPYLLEQSPPLSRPILAAAGWRINSARPAFPPPPGLISEWLRAPSTPLTGPDPAAVGRRINTARPAFPPPLGAITECRLVERIHMVLPYLPEPSPLLNSPHYRRCTAVLLVFQNPHTQLLPLNTPIPRHYPPPRRFCPPPVPEAAPENRMKVGAGHTSGAPTTSFTAYATHYARFSPLRDYNPAGCGPARRSLQFM
ncbi:hypothetical protein FB451DRAFT_1372397 [Mycena latifolia]|nr:hypothetical protein FB451DRAFT_1372397 [Mycena latifolia]